MHGVFAVHQPVAGIVLAAGASQRFGQLKQVLPWRGKPIVRHVTQVALLAGLRHVIVVTGNSATKILGRTGSQEIATPDYRFLDNDLKMSMTRLRKGELLINHAVYRQPVKIIFPKPAYRQE